MVYHFLSRGLYMPRCIPDMRQILDMTLSRCLQLLPDPAPVDHVCTFSGFKTTIYLRIVHASINFEHDRVCLAPSHRFQLPPHPQADGHSHVCVDLARHQMVSLFAL